MSTNNHEAFHYLMKYERNIGGEELVAEAIARSIKNELARQRQAAARVILKLNELGLLHLLRLKKRSK